MPPSKFSILVVEEDSRVSRLVRDRLEKAFPEIRIEIAGSPLKAQAICSKFPPSWIIWEALSRDGAFLHDYVISIPAPLWSRVVPISAHPTALEAAQARGALAPFSKQPEALHSWSEGLVDHFRKHCPMKSGKRR